MNIVSTREVLSRNGTKGARISQVQVIEIDGKHYELPIWSDENGDIIWSLGEPKLIENEGSIER